MNNPSPDHSSAKVAQEQVAQDQVTENNRNFKRNSLIIVINALVSLALVFGLMLTGFADPIAWTAGITLFTAVFWITEAIPIPATSLIPFFAFPLAGVLTHKEAAASLGNHVIMLLMGAFMLSKAIERSEVHKRFALFMIRVTGGRSAKRLVLAFMLTAALLSMWISNSATTLMLLPIAMAVLQPIKDPRVTAAVLLGMAYAASVGGVGTPIGTPPNIIFMSVYQETTGTDLAFTDWMMIGIPVVLIAIPIMALWLTRHLGELESFEVPKVGQWQAKEKRVLAIFGLVAVAWITRQFWTGALGMKEVGDSTIALTGLLLMFIIPSGDKNDRLLDWKTANDIPWGMLLLFAGGICVAKAFTASGLSQQIGDLLGSFSDLPMLWLILIICLFVTFLTEITSNTATATLLMPILAVTGSAMGLDPAVLMVPAVISASCAFMLPVATAPNTIIYSTEKFTIRTMAKEGAILNVLIAVVVTGVAYVSLV